jgi:hypothetical protein
MTLGNMRANGMRTLAAWCLGRGCIHFRVLDESGYPDDVAAPEFRACGCAQLRHCGQKLRPRTKESSCGIVETHVSFAILHLDAPRLKRAGIKGVTLKPRDLNRRVGDVRH